MDIPPPHVYARADSYSNALPRNNDGQQDEKQQQNQSTLQRMLSLASSIYSSHSNPLSRENSTSAAAPHLPRKSSKRASAAFTRSEPWHADAREIEPVFVVEDTGTKMLSIARRYGCVAQLFCSSSCTLLNLCSLPTGS